MPSMRVFELAKELNMPARQMIQKLRSAGVPVSGNFHELTEDQVSRVRNLISGKQSVGDAGLRSRADGTRRVISSRRSAEEPQDTEEEPRVITISAKTQQDQAEEDDNRPRRRRRRKLEEDLEVEAESLTEDSQEQTQTAEKVEDEQKEEKASTPSEPEPVAEKPEPEVDKEPEPVTPKTAQKKVAPVEEARPVTRPDKIRTKAPAQPLQEQPKEIPTKAKPDKKQDKKRSKEAEQPDQWDKEESKKPAKRRVEFGKGARKKNVLDYYSSSEMRGPRKRKSDRAKDRKGDPGLVKGEEEAKHVFNPRKKKIKIGNQVTIGELAGLIGIKATNILKKMMEEGTMATINQVIPGETAALLAADFDVEVELATFELEDLLKEEEIEESDLENRSPIVTIMGHVDHGKTSLLDRIRSTRVAEGEAGGITQHIGAYHVEAGGQNITFLDTPGHEAFTNMRARGAHCTDIVILVVAADDDVQPQTIEAINHAKAANVPIIVAINKIDRPQADINKIQQSLLEHELIPENLGGSTIFVNVSATRGDGVDELLEMIQLQAEVLELKSTSKGFSRGVVIESKVRRGQGTMGTVLVQRGMMKIGDYFVCGVTHGRVRSMFNEYGKAKKEAGPSIPVEISGWSDQPEVGEQFITLEDERTARQIAEERTQQQKEKNVGKQQKMQLENVFSQLDEQDQVEIRLLIKADVQGSAEALQSSLEQLGNDKISVNVIHSGVGNITTTDITLASASDAIVIAFNVQVDAKAKQLRSQEGVDVRNYDIIYNALDDVKAAMEGLLEPEIREEVVGRLEVRQVFNSAKNGMVFGGLVTEGRLLRNDLARVLRNGDNLYEGTIISLKRFKDDVREVTNNHECGLVMDFPEIQEGDVVVAYQQVEEKATL